MAEIRPKAIDKLLRLSLLDALRERRSRRFGLGMRIEGEPLAYTSQHPPLSLSQEEEAILAFAAAGITGPVMSDWRFAKGSGGNMMAGIVGRTVGSADAIGNVALVVINDEAAYLMKRPRDLDAAELAEGLRLNSEGQFLEAWQLCRIKIADARCAPPLDLPYNINPNRWSLYARGTTYFLPVADLTFFYINALLELFNEDTGLYALDERAMFMPAGVGRFARSKGGHMDDDPRKLKAVPIEFVERLIAEMIAVEQGMMLQNLGLVCEAMGLGGFPHFTSHDSAWFEALGFRRAELPLTRFYNVPAPASWFLNMLKQDVGVSFPVGLERDGKVLLKSYCPPYYPSMEAAVRAVVEVKFGANGLWRAEPPASAWKQPAKVMKNIPPISDKAIGATIAYCEYLWKRYSRFPVYLPPFHTLMGFQAHHVDTGFYDQYYQPGALNERHRRHLEEWH